MLSAVGLANHIGETQNPHDNTDAVTKDILQRIMSQ